MTATGKGTLDTNEEIVRLLVLQLRMQMDSQAQAILELNRAGFSNSRIATLLNTTPDTVKVALQRARKPKSGKTAGRSNRAGDSHRRAIGEAS